MRIIAGQYKGREILSPVGRETTRPITGLVRKSLFGMLGEDLTGQTVLDLYCGTGTLGLEALSRGAEHCWFADRDRSALHLLRRNLELLGAGDRGTIWPGDVVSRLAGWVGGLGAFGGFVFPNVLALFLVRTPGAAAVSGASAALSGAGFQGEAGGLTVRAVEAWTRGDPGYARGYVVLAVLSLVSILITFILKARAGDGTKGR